MATLKAHNYKQVETQAYQACFPDTPPLITNLVQKPTVLQRYWSTAAIRDSVKTTVLMSLECKLTRFS